jgi:hypothetical protein
MDTLTSHELMIVIGVLGYWIRECPEEEIYQTITVKLLKELRKRFRFA